MLTLMMSMPSHSQVPPLNDEKQAELGWSLDLRNAYAAYKESTKGPGIDDRSMKDFYERRTQEALALIARIEEEQGPEHLGAALMRLELAFHLWQPSYQDYERYQQLVLDGVSMAARIEGALPDYGAFLLTHLAFLQYEHGQEFEGEALMRHVMENGGINQLRRQVEHMSRMLGTDDKSLNAADPDALSMQIGRLKGMTQALRFTNEPTRAERYEQRRKALIKGQ